MIRGSTAATRLTFTIVACGLIGCGDGTPPEPRTPRPIVAAAGEAPIPAVAAEASVPVPAPPPAPTLAEAPRIDLLANRARWHLHSDQGLVVPVGSEALRKYVLDYQDPWGPVRSVNGVPARPLQRKASLTVPSDGGAARVTVLHQGAPPKVSVDRRALRGAADDDAVAGAWTYTTYAIDAPLDAGEHVITLTPARKGQVIATVTLGAAAAAITPDPCASATDAAGVDGALGGWRRLSLYQEIPADAYLAITPTGAGHARVRVTPSGGAAVTLLDVDVSAGAPTPQVLSLASVAGEVVRLDLEVDGARCDRVAWRDAAIAVAATPPRPRPAPIDHVVLLVVDTLRADRLAAYGPTRVQTPRLTAAAAARGAVFLHNQAMAPSSPPSHATIHTGQIPRVHGVAGDDGKLAADAPMLSAILGDAGVFAGYVGDNDFAMGRLRKAARWRRVRARIFDGGGKDCAPIVEGVLAMAREATTAGQRFFISALPIEPHVPYRHHAGITEKYLGGRFERPLVDKVGGNHLEGIAGGRIRMSPRLWDQLRALHDGEVEYLDGCFGALEDGLAALGVADRTAIVVTSDHGEGLGERGGRVGHAYSLHRELIDVPLIILAGGVGPAQIATPTSNGDIAATILDLMGLPADPRIQGASVLPLVLGPALPRVVASEYGRSYAVRAARWHLVVEYDGSATLHDVVADPEEAQDVAARQPMVMRYLRDAAGLYLAHRKAWHAATWGALNDVAATSPLARGTLAP